MTVRLRWGGWGRGLNSREEMWGALTSRKVSGSGEKWEAEGVFRCSAAALATSKPRIKGRLVSQENKILDIR